MSRETWRRKVKRTMGSRHEVLIKQIQDVFTTFCDVFATKTADVVSNVEQARLNVASNLVARSLFNDGDDTIAPRGIASANFLYF